MSPLLLLLALAGPADENDAIISLPGLGALYRLDLDTLALTPFVSGLATPFYGVWATDGFLYVPDRTLGLIFKISDAGDVEIFAGGGFLETPVTVAQAPDGTLVASDIFSQTIVALGPDGEQTLVADALTSGGVLDAPGGIGFSPDGLLYVSNNLPNTIASVDIETGEVELVTNGGGLLSQPGGIAVDGAGNLFVANYGNFTISRVRLETGVTEVFCDDPFMISPNDVRLAAGGGLRVTTKNGALVHIDALGQLSVVLQDQDFGEWDGVAVPLDHPPCTGRFLPYGAGLAGSGGFVPRLGGIFSPCPGAAVALEFEGFLGNSAGHLFWSLLPGSVPFKGGTLHLGLGGPWGLIPLPYPGVGPGAGELTLPFTFPDDPSLSGVSVYLQAAAADLGAIKKVSLSNALEERIGS